MITTLFTIALFISLICVGARIITSPGMMGYFLRKKYDIRARAIRSMESNIGNIDKDIAMHEDSLTGYKLKIKLDEGEAAKVILIQKHIDQQKLERVRVVMRIKPLIVRQDIIKPLIACCTCMASLWTIIWFVPGLYLMSSEMNLLFIIPTILIVAAMNSIIMAVYDYLVEKTKCNCK